MKNYKDLMSVPEVALLDRLRQLEAELIARNLLPIGYAKEVEDDLRKSIEGEIVEDQDGNKYQIDEFNLSSFGDGELGYNPISGVVMIVCEEEDDMPYINDTWSKVISLTKPPLL
jgi:hypothetical protein